MNQIQQNTIDHMVARLKNERGLDATYDVRMVGSFAYVQFHVKTPDPFPELRVGPQGGWWSDSECRGGEIRSFANPAMDSLLYADQRLACQTINTSGQRSRHVLGRTKQRTNNSKTTCETITLDRACRAVVVYNEGLYGCVKNPDLDRRAFDVFAHGLGQTPEDIERQVYFIGKDYGGVAGRPSAIELVPAIASDIFNNRMEYELAAVSGPAILSQVADRSTIEILYRPFVKTLVDKNGRETSNWLVWATKFWHHLKPDAFPIEDSRVDDFFVIRDYDGPVDRYMKLLEKFRSFVLSYRHWLPELRRADGGVDGEVDGKPVCSDNKLWDKMCYGLGDLDRAGM